MATNNHQIADDNNSSSQGRLSEPVNALVSLIVSERKNVASRRRHPHTCTMFEKMEDEHIDMIKLLCGLNDIIIKKMEDNQRINSAKFDKMIALLEKIAGE